MKEYKKHEFCKHVGCNEYKKPKLERLCKTECCFSAWAFHNFLIEKGYEILR